MTFDYDVIVVGAGHAGCEAAHAAARLGARTLLITIDMTKIAQMSCNPAIGGIAKGQIVREIDALGGLTGIITDRTAIQFRMLNRSKGPAMWSPRSQSDLMRFSALWREMLEQTDNLEMWQDSVTSLILDGNRVCGVRTAMGVEFSAKAVVLTAGTFLNGLMHIGRVMIEGGRVAEPPARGLTEQLRDLGLTVGRMKTGTPVRIDGRTIDFSLATPQPGDDGDFHKFSFLPDVRRELRQRPCYTVSTSTATHDILRAGLPDSPLYNGQIQSIGPRYCPSIETKIVTFADKDSHHLFLEPQGETTTEYYLNGFSSSLPINIQVEALATIPALANANIFRPGYAIEYDFFDPTQLRHSLESKLVVGLYLAGQVNGTTGYEEAAGQGLVAGVNAARAVDGMPPLVLARDTAYIGVLIDDLVTKGVDEPYRMFTSRAEYRILLRQDNADARLTHIGYKVGLATEERMELCRSKYRQADLLREYLETARLTPDEANPMLERCGETPISQSQPMVALLRRVGVAITSLCEASPELSWFIEENVEVVRRDEIIESVEVAVKYAGYIERERQLADKLLRLDDVKLRGKLDYAALKALSTEARQKLAAIDPETVGQASRIPGVSPSDVSILLLLLGR